MPSNTILEKVTQSVNLSKNAKDKKLMQHNIGQFQKLPFPPPPHPLYLTYCKMADQIPHLFVGLQGQNQCPTSCD